MTRYIHVSTSHDAISLDGNTMSTTCTVDLLSRPARGPMVSQSISVGIEHTCQGPNLRVDFAAIEEKVRVKGHEIAEAYIAARASEAA